MRIERIFMSNPIRKFRSWLTEAKEKSCAVCFGRYNPVTLGHIQLFKKISEEARKIQGDGLIYTSKTHDPKKNPLTYQEKITFLKKAVGIPGNVKVVKDESVSTLFNCIAELVKQGYARIVVVGGSDRQSDMKRVADYGKSLGSEVTFASSGDRDPDAEGVSGISASLVRKMAAEGKLTEFLKLVPFDRRTGTDLYNTVRKGMGI